MTPYEYLLKYRRLTVNLVGGGLVSDIDVHEYRNAQDVFDKRNTDDNPDNNVNNISADHDAAPGWDVAWPALRSKIAKHGKKLGGNKYTLKLPLETKGNPNPPITFEESVDTAALMTVYIGKGSPENIAQALRLAEAFGLVQGNQAAMQKYCDAYIGLDCSGYVGNYLKVEGSTLVGPSTKSTKFAPEGQRLSTLDEVEPRSVLCWKKTNHVAIVDHNFGKILQAPNYNTEILRCLVCEATGSELVKDDPHTDGLNYTLYEIHPPDKNKVFKVKRGIGGTKLAEVWMAKLL